MIQEILLDVHDARIQVEDIKEACSSTLSELKESVTERAECAAQKLDKVFNYLMEAFDNRMEIVLHKAQVRFMPIVCTRSKAFL